MIPGDARCSDHFALEQVNHVAFAITRRSVIFPDMAPAFDQSFDNQSG